MTIKQFKFNELVSNTPKIRGIPTTEYKSMGSYPVIDQGIKFIAGYSDNENSLYKDTLPVVVFGDHTLSIKYLDFPFCAGADGVQILKPNTDVITGKFLYYAIMNLNIQSLGYSRHFKVLKKSIFYVPDIEEQHRIVKILDLAKSLIEKRKQAISYLDDYVKAVFLDMFGDPVSNPKGWEVKTIKTISHKITDGEHLNPTFSEDGMPMIMAGHVLETGVDTKSARKVPSELGKAFRKKCNPEKNDLLLVSRGATIGRLCRVTTSELFCLMGSVILIKPDHDIVNSAFLSELLKHPRMYSKLFNSSGSSAQQAIYLKDIKKLDCVIPPIEDQRDFEKIVLEVDTIKQKMQFQLKELEDNFQAQLQKAFRGE